MLAFYYMWRSGGILCVWLSGTRQDSVEIDAITLRTYGTRARSWIDTWVASHNFTKDWLTAKTVGNQSDYG